MAIHVDDRVGAPPESPPANPARRVLTDPADSLAAARALADGFAVGHGFANFYGITARADLDSVRRVNLMKGRPADQIGSIAVPPSGIAELFDWTALPVGLTRRAVLGVIDTFYGLGHFAVDCMAQKYGERKLFEFVKLTLREDNTYDMASREAYGVPFKTVDKGCLTWIKKTA